MLRTVEGAAGIEPAGGPVVPSDRGNLVAAVAVAAAGLVACLYRVGTPSLYIEEAVTATFVRVGPTDFVDALRYDGGNQALYYVLARGWSTVSTSETWLRLLSVVFAVAALAVLHRLACRLFESRVALIALVLLALNPFFVRYAQEARGYSLSLLLITSAALALVGAVDSGSWRSWALYGVLAALAVWAHLFGLFFVAAMSVSLLVLGPAELPWRRVVAAGALSAALLAPLVPLALARSSGEDAWTPKDATSPALVKQVATAQLGQRGTVANLAVAAAAGAGLVVPVAALRARRRGRAGWSHAMVAAWAAAPAGAVAVSLLVPILAPHYLIAGLPAIALLAAVGLDRLRPLPWLLAALLVVAGLSASRIVDAAGEVRLEDWRPATASILGSMEAGDRLVFYAPYMRLPFEYYASRAGFPRDALPTLIPGEARFAPLPVGRIRSPYLPADVDLLRAPSPGALWVVSYLLPQDESTVSYAELTAVVEGSHRLVEERSFTGIRVRRYVPGEPRA